MIDLIIYILLAFAFVMMMHFSMGIANPFNLTIFITIFVVSGVIGWYLDSYITGLAGAVTLSLILWNNVFG